MRVKKIIILLFCVSFAFCASSQQKQQQAQAKDPRYQYNMGLVYLNQSYVNPSLIDTAISYFVKTLALDTRFYQAWNAIGLAHSLKGNLEEAAKAYQKCLEISPQFTEAHNNLGTIYQEQNQLDKAEAEFEKALLDTSYPSRELPYYNLARLYLVQNRLDLAFEHVQKAIQIRPRLAMAHNLKGMILEKQNNLGDAVAAYEQAVRIVPDDVQFNFNLAAAYFKANEFGKARQIFFKISPLATDPGLKVRISQYLKDLAGKGLAGA